VPKTLVFISATMVSSWAAAGRENNGENYHMVRVLGTLFGISWTSLYPCVSINQSISSAGGSKRRCSGTGSCVA